MSSSSSGVALYAITNFAKEKWQLTTDRFPFLTESFRDIAVSGLEGVVKPEPEIYQRSAPTQQSCSRTVRVHR